MRRWALVLAWAIFPALLFAQVATTPTGWATAGGPAVPIAQPGAPLVTTPVATLGTYSPSAVGATNATANGVAGASNSTIGSVPPVANATEMQVQYSPPYPTVVGAGGQYAPPTATTPGAINFNTGAAQFASAYDLAPQSPASLGELARQWRQQRQAQNARTYTNEDINRIEQQYGPPTGGVSATAVNAGATTTGEPATAAPPQSNMGTSAPPAAPRSPFQPPTNATQTSAPPPQGRVEYPQQPASDTERNDSGAREGLPGTASNLPTILLVGASVLLVGLLLRRRNHRRSGVGF